MNGLLIHNNTFINYKGTGNDTQAWSAIKFGVPTEDVEYSVLNTSIEFNDFSRMGPEQVAISSHLTNPISSPNNYFGSETGPSGCCNHNGEGELAGPGIAFSPWCKVCPFIFLSHFPPSMSPPTNATHTKGSHLRNLILSYSSRLQWL